MEKKDLGVIINTFDTAVGEAVGKRESHTPKIEAPDNVKADEVVTVRVSVGPHPNMVEHSIRWLEVFFYEDGRAFNPVMLARISFNAPTTDPDISLKMRFSKNGVIHALKYCNLHGLWSAKKEITVA